MQAGRTALEAQLDAAFDRRELAEAKLRQVQELEAQRVKMHLEREAQFEQLSQVGGWGVNVSTIFGYVLAAVAGGWVGAQTWQYHFWLWYKRLFAVNGKIEIFWHA